MKITRSYWLGLGSGLILSAMLTLIIPVQHQGQVVPPQKPTSVQPVQQPVQQPATLPLPEEKKPADPPAAAQPPQEVPSNTQVEQSFVIPEGANAYRIADLLAAQGLINNRDDFLECVYQMGVSSRFRAGNYSLPMGLTPEELIPKLLMK